MVPVFVEFAGVDHECDVLLDGGAFSHRRNVGRVGRRQLQVSSADCGDYNGREVFSFLVYSRPARSCLGMLLGRVVTKSIFGGPWA